MKRPFKVLVSLVTLVAFSVNTFSYDLSMLGALDTVSKAWAAESAPDLTSVGSESAGGPGSPRQLRAGTFALPAYLGTVQYVNIADHGAAGTVIHIQDAHCNYAAQRRISEIVGYLQGEYGIRSVNLEGGFRDYDLSVFTGIGDLAVRQSVADHFVKEGRVTGAEYFAANNPDKVDLWGIEDPALYVANLNVYRDSLAHKEEVEKALKALGHILSNLKTRVYPKPLLEFDAKYGQYKAGNLEFREYLEYLVNAAKAASISIKSFSNIYLLNQALDAEAGIDFKKANAERDALIDILQKKLSKKSMEELVFNTVEFKAERISQKQYYTYLVNKSRAIGVDLSIFPVLQKYVVYISIYESINKTRIMAELEILEDGVRGALCANDTERELAALAKNLALLKNFFNISLTRSDYAYYKRDADAFAMRRFTDFIDKTAPLYKIDARPPDNAANIDEYRRRMAQFYEYSFMRDDAFLKNLRFTNDERRTTNDGRRVAVLITGGFHTDNLRDLFAAKGVNYISILPNFKNEDGYESGYYALLQGRKDPLEKIIMAILPVSALAIASFLTKMPGLKDQDRREMAFNIEVRLAAAIAEGRPGILVKRGSDNIVALGPKGELPLDTPGLRPLYMTVPEARKIVPEAPAMVKPADVPGAQKDEGARVPLGPKAGIAYIPLVTAISMAAGFAALAAKIGLMPALLVSLALTTISLFLIGAYMHGKSDFKSKATGVMLWILAVPGPVIFVNSFDKSALGAQDITAVPTIAYPEPVKPARTIVSPNLAPVTLTPDLSVPAAPYESMETNAPSEQKPPAPVRVRSVEKAAERPAPAPTRSTPQRAWGSAKHRRAMSQAEREFADMILPYMNQAVKIAEGNPNNFGVLSLDVDSPSEANAILNHSIINNYARWVSAGKPGHFVDYMAYRGGPVGKGWAPIGANNDPRGLNRNWAPNVRKNLREQLDSETYARLRGVKHKTPVRQASSRGKVRTGRAGKGVLGFVERALQRLDVDTDRPIVQNFWIPLIEESVMALALLLPGSFAVAGYAVARMLFTIGHLIQNRAPPSGGEYSPTQKVAFPFIYSAVSVSSLLFVAALPQVALIVAPLAGFIAHSLGNWSIDTVFPGYQKGVLGAVGRAKANRELIKRAFERGNDILPKLLNERMGVVEAALARSSSNEFNGEPRAAKLAGYDINGENAYLVEMGTIDGVAKLNFVAVVDAGTGKILRIYCGVPNTVSLAVQMYRLANGKGKTVNVDGEDYVELRPDADIPNKGIAARLDRDVRGALGDGAKIGDIAKATQYAKDPIARYSWEVLAAPKGFAILWSLMKFMRRLDAGAKAAVMHLLRLPAADGFALADGVLRVKAKNVEGGFYSGAQHMISLLVGRKGVSGRVFIHELAHHIYGSLDKDRKDKLMAHLAGKKGSMISILKNPLYENLTLLPESEMLDHLMSELFAYMLDSLVANDARMVAITAEDLDMLKALGILPGDFVSGVLTDAAEEISDGEFSNRVGKIQMKAMLNAYMEHKEREKKSREEEDAQAWLEKMREYLMKYNLEKVPGLIGLDKGAGLLKLINQRFGTGGAKSVMSKGYEPDMVIKDMLGQRMIAEQPNHYERLSYDDNVSIRPMKPGITYIIRSLFRPDASWMRGWKAEGLLMSGGSNSQGKYAIPTPARPPLVTDELRRMYPGLSEEALLRKAALREIPFTFLPARFINRMHTNLTGAQRRGRILGLSEIYIGMAAGTFMGAWLAGAVTASLSLTWAIPIALAAVSLFALYGNFFAHLDWNLSGRTPLMAGKADTTARAIRPAEPGDAAAIADLSARIRLGVQGADGDKRDIMIALYESAIAGAGMDNSGLARSRVIVATDGAGKVTGYILADINDEPTAEGYKDVYIAEIAVDEAEEGKGIATSLLARMEKEMVLSYGDRGIRLHGVPVNDKILSIAGKAGFTITQNPDVRSMKSYAFSKNIAPLASPARVELDYRSSPASRMRAPVSLRDVLQRLRELAGPGHTDPAVSGKIRFVDDIGPANDTQAMVWSNLETISPADKASERWAVENMISLIRAVLANALYSNHDTVVEVRAFIAPDGRPAISIRNTGPPVDIEKIRSSALGNIAAGRNYGLTADEVRNMSPDAVLKLIFLPKVTTKERTGWMKMMGKREPQGMGIGLTTVAKIMEASRGEIKVESGPGRDTTFTFIFEAAAASDYGELPEIALSDEDLALSQSLVRDLHETWAYERFRLNVASGKRPDEPRWKEFNPYGDPAMANKEARIRSELEKVRSRPLHVYHKMYRISPEGKLERNIMHGYEQLPEYMQKDNLESAKAAVWLVREADRRNITYEDLLKALEEALGMLESGKALDPSFAVDPARAYVLYAGYVMHGLWLKRFRALGKEPDESMRKAFIGLDSFMQKLDLNIIYAAMAVSGSPKPAASDLAAPSKKAATPLGVEGRQPTAPREIVLRIEPMRIPNLRNLSGEESRRIYGALVKDKRIEIFSKIAGTLKEYYGDNAAQTLSKAIFIDGKKITMRDILEFGISAFLNNSCDAVYDRDLEGGLADIEVRVSRERVKITVRDNGASIPRGQEEMLFNQEIVSLKDRKTRLGGVGEALYVLNRYIAAWPYGGNRSGRNRLDNIEGTVFSFELNINDDAIRRAALRRFEERGMENLGLGEVSLEDGRTGNGGYILKARGNMTVLSQEDVKKGLAAAPAAGSWKPYDREWTRTAWYRETGASIAFGALVFCVMNLAGALEAARIASAMGGALFFLLGHIDPRTLFKKDRPYFVKDASPSWVSTFALGKGISLYTALSGSWDGILFGIALTVMTASAHFLLNDRYLRIRSEEFERLHPRAADGTFKDKRVPIRTADGRFATPEQAAQERERAASEEGSGAKEGIVYSFPAFKEGNTAVIDRRDEGGRTLGINVGGFLLYGPVKGADFRMLTPIMTLCTGVCVQAMADDGSFYYGLAHIQLDGRDKRFGLDEHLLNIQNRLVNEFGIRPEKIRYLVDYNPESYAPFREGEVRFNPTNGFDRTKIAFIKRDGSLVGDFIEVNQSGVTIRKNRDTLDEFLVPQLEPERPGDDRRISWSSEIFTAARPQGPTLPGPTRANVRGMATLAAAGAGCLVGGVPGLWIFTIVALLDLFGFGDKLGLAIRNLVIPVTAGPAAPTSLAKTGPQVLSMPAAAPAPRQAPDIEIVPAAFNSALLAELVKIETGAEGFTAEPAADVRERLAGSMKLGTVFVATQGGRPVGFAEYSISMAGNEPQLERLIVIKTVQNQRIGTRLIDRVVEDLIRFSAQAGKSEFGFTIVSTVTAKDFYARYFASRLPANSPHPWSLKAIEIKDEKILPIDGYVPETKFRVIVRPRPAAAPAPTPTVPAEIAIKAPVAAVDQRVVPIKSALDQAYPNYVENINVAPEEPGKPAMLEISFRNGPAPLRLPATATHEKAVSEASRHIARFVDTKSELAACLMYWNHGLDKAKMETEEYDRAITAVAGRLQANVAENGKASNGEAKSRQADVFKGVSLPAEFDKLKDTARAAEFMNIGRNHTWRQKLAASPEARELPSIGNASAAVRAATPAEPMYAAAKEIVPEIVAAANRDAHTFITSPANEDELAKDVNIDSGVKRTLGASSHYVTANHYSIDGGFANLKAVLEKQELVKRFNDKVNIEKKPTTRWAIRVVSEADRKAAIAYLMSELLKLNQSNEVAANSAMERIHVMIIGVNRGQRMNPVVDLFLDFGMMELDRYGKEYQESELRPELREYVARLLRESTTNFDIVNAGNIMDYLKKIFSGEEVLRIRPIDWKSIQDWKDRQDAVLSSV